MRNILSKILFVLFLVGFITPVGAVEYGGLGGKPANPDPKNPRTKSIFIFELEPGAKKKDEVLVVNNTKQSKTVLVYATDSQKSTDGSFACEQYSDTKDKVGKWIKLAKKEITLGPAKNEKIPFTIQAPDNVSVGEENGCILIQEKKTTNEIDSGVSLSFRTGLRVVVTIPGKQVRELKFNSFDVNKGEENIKSKIAIENKGSVSIDTSIQLKSQYLFGFKHYQVSNQYPILRSETSVYNFEIPKPYWGGIIKIDAAATYDKSDSAKVGVNTSKQPTKIKSDNKYIFIFPKLTALLIELAILISLIAGTILLVKKWKDNKTLYKNLTDYSVKPGDDISSIAKNFDVYWKTLVKINKLKPPYLLSKGQKIKVPGNQGNKFNSSKKSDAFDIKFKVKKKNK